MANHQDMATHPSTLGSVIAPQAHHPAAHAHRAEILLLYRILIAAVAFGLVFALGAHAG